MEHTTELRHFGVKGMRWGHRKPEEVAAKQASKAAAIEAKNQVRAGKVSARYKKSADLERQGVKDADLEATGIKARIKSGRSPVDSVTEDADGNVIKTQTYRSDVEMLKALQEGSRVGKELTKVYDGRAAVFAKRAAGKKLSKADLAVKQEVYKQGMTTAKTFGVLAVGMGAIGAVSGRPIFAIAGAGLGAVAISSAVSTKRNDR